MLTCEFTELLYEHLCAAFPGMRIDMRAATGPHGCYITIWGPASDQALMLAIDSEDVASYIFDCGLVAGSERYFEYASPVFLEQLVAWIRSWHAKN